MRHSILLVLYTLCGFSIVSSQSINLLNHWSGNIDAFVTGAPLAGDSNTNGRVDVSLQPVSFNIDSADLSSTTNITKAYLYWGGTQSESAGACSAVPDSVITLTIPGLGSQIITADTNFCSDGGSSSYDILMSRADITSILSSGLVFGTYSFDGYSGLWGDGATDNASFSLVIIYEDSNLDYQGISLSDGLLTFVNSTSIIPATGLTVGNSPTGKLTWYTLEGDITGSGTEEVTVTGQPGPAIPLTVSDAINLVTNPMNHTINVFSPPDTTSYGVDIDEFSIDAALSAGDNNISVSYSAGTDKWWLVFQLITVQQDDPSIASTIFVSEDGNVGIGTIAPSHKLEVCGSIGTSAATVTTSITCSSDSRYKSNIQTLSNALHRVMQLNGVSYNWIEDSFPDMGFTDRLQFGLVAQEVQQILPELVYSDPNDYLSIDYVKLSPILIEAIKEQQAIIKSQDQRLIEIEEQLKRQSEVISNLLIHIEASK
jgi:hypothetical protein